MVRLVMEPTGLRIKCSSTSHALPGGAGGERRGRGGYEAFADKRERHHDVGSEQTGTIASPGGAAAASAPGRQSLAILLHTKLQQAPNVQILILCASGENEK